MSKKIMKRSLALGALMAFVITGSAMANQTVYTDINNTYITIGMTEKDDNGEYVSGTRATGRSVAIGGDAEAGGTAGSVAVGFSAKATSPTSTAIGMNAKASATGAVAIGAGSQATEKNTVSFGYTSTTGDVYREIVMIAEGTTDTSAVNLKQLKDALGVGDGVTAINEQMMREQYAGTNYIVTDSLTKDGTNLIEVDKVLDAQIKVNADAIALKANAADVYTKTETDNTFATKTALEDKADKADTLSGYGIKDAYTKTEVDSLLGGSSAAIAGINQRLDRTNAKINKVGAGAAALAALHPLDYDPDDKLTFSAGMGNYAGENAAALGAFYRPNEKFMVSLGGTMGNGENMVNLGLSIGLDKPNGLAKLSKRELIQKVNAVEAENDALEDRVAKLEALVAQLASK